MDEISEYNWITSDVLNAYATGCDVNQIVGAFCISTNLDELSAALDALTELKDICEEYYGRGY